MQEQFKYGHIVKGQRRTLKRVHNWCTRNVYMITKNEDTWVSIKSIGAWAIGVIGAIGVIIVSGFFAWIASSIIQIDKKLDIVAAQQLSQIVQINADLVRVIGDIDKAQLNIDDHRLRIAKLEFYRSQEK